MAGGFPFQKDKKKDDKDKAKQEAIARRMKKNDKDKKDKGGY